MALGVEANPVRSVTIALVITKPSIALINKNSATIVTSMGIQQKLVGMNQLRNPSRKAEGVHSIAMIVYSPDMVMAVGKAMAADMVMYIMLMLKGLKRKLAMLLCMK